MSHSLNGYDVDGVRAFRSIVERDLSKAGRTPTVVAHWESGSRARVEFGEIVSHIGGDGELNAMQTLLAALAACDVDVVAMHASLAGMKVEALSVEVTGRFNVASFLGITDAPGPGFEQISYLVKLSASGATERQLAELRRRCETSSPVGDSLTRNVKVEFNFEIEERGAGQIA